MIRFILGIFGLVRANNKGGHLCPPSESLQLAPCYFYRVNPMFLKTPIRLCVSLYARTGISQGYLPQRASRTQALSRREKQSLCTKSRCLDLLPCTPSLLSCAVSSSAFSFLSSLVLAARALVADANGKNRANKSSWILSQTL